ncbi:cupin domain-containing protein [Mesorhizobium sp. M0938]
MKSIVVAAAVFAMTVPAHANSEVVVTRVGSTPSAVGPAENFTGSVRVDSRFKGTDPARVGGAIVTFEPGARTAWHTHPLGQTLIVTAGVGRVQHWDGPVQEIRPGDTVWIPPGVKHWHGASPTVAMSHIAISESLNGNGVTWMEKVSDEQYRR